MNFPTMLGILVRWVLTLILLYYVFQEVTGSATRVWIITVSGAIELMSLLENKRNLISLRGRK